MVHASYTEARANLAALLDRATNDRETVIIARRGTPDVAMIAADELASLQETVHLLRSPRNAARLLAALERAERGEGIRMSPDELRVELGLIER
ncbi:MAG TPA: type II toxin-antitoxin system prevent-host-death family antitoxin [Chloroflexota bacterium]|jgi:antitoxin YefM